MQDLNDLRLFLQVASAKGFAAASRMTGIPRATLSRRVADFEASLGQRLIERNSRNFRLTPSGELLASKTRPLLNTVEAAFEDLAALEGAGEVRFAVPPSILELHLDQMLIDYGVQMPNLRLKLEATNRRIDLWREDFDFVIRAGDPSHAPPDLVVLPLARIEHHLVIAPELADKLRPALSETLTEMAPLAWGNPQGQSTWRLLDDKGATRIIPLQPKLAVEDMSLLRRAAIAGLGLALLPSPLVREDIEAGRLIAPKFDLRGPQGQIHALHTGSDGMRASVRHCLDFLARRYAQTCASPVS